MADQSDVELTLAGLVAAVLYPEGADEPSLLGPLVRIYRGWPNQSALDADLAAGHLNVSVFPDPGGGLNTTRFPAEFAVSTPASATLSVAVAGIAATFSGTAGANQLAGLLADGVAVVHRTAAGDTPALVAAILADALRASRVVQLSGASVFVPGAAVLVGRVVADQPAQMETRRQRQSFRISCWCPDPATRDAAAGAIDAALAVPAFIDLPDGSAGRLRYVGTTVVDRGQDASLFRRDLVYSVEYATTLNARLPSMIFGDATLAAATGPVLATRLS